MAHASYLREPPFIFDAIRFLKPICESEKYMNWFEYDLCAIGRPYDFDKFDSELNEVAFWGDLFIALYCLEWLVCFLFLISKVFNLHGCQFVSLTHWFNHKGRHMFFLACVQT